MHVVTYAAAPEKRGSATRWRVTNLPGAANLTFRLNGQPFTRFVVVGPRTIELTLRYCRGSGQSLPQRLPNTSHLVNVRSAALMSSRLR